MFANLFSDLKINMLTASIHNINVWAWIKWETCIDHMRAPVQMFTKLRTAGVGKNTSKKASILHLHKRTSCEYAFLNCHSNHWSKSQSLIFMNYRQPPANLVGICHGMNPPYKYFMLKRVANTRETWADTVWTMSPHILPVWWTWFGLDVISTLRGESVSLGTFASG